MNIEQARKLKAGNRVQVMSVDGDKVLYKSVIQFIPDRPEYHSPVGDHHGIWISLSDGNEWLSTRLELCP